MLFVDGNGYRVPVEDLSDGYRSILSMTFELIRQLAATYGPKRVFDPKDPFKVNMPGVVLIDEVDAHLHPTWQRKVGLWFGSISPSCNSSSPLTAPWFVRPPRRVRCGGSPCLERTRNPGR